MREINVDFELKFTKKFKIPENMVFIDFEQYIISSFNLPNEVFIENLLIGKNQRIHDEHKYKEIEKIECNHFIFDLRPIIDILFEKQNKSKLGIIPKFIPNQDFIYTGFEVSKCDYYNAYKVQDKSENSYQIRFFPRINFNDFRDKEIYFNKELEYSMKLKHRNLNQFKGITYDFFKGERGIIVEDFNGNSITENFPEEYLNKITILYQLIDILYFLYENGINHQRIIPDNIIINEIYQLRLKESGFNQLSDYQIKKLNIESYDSVYIHPNSKSKKKRILWSYGCIAFYLFTKKHPYDGSRVDMIENFSKNKNFYSESDINDPIFNEIISYCCNIEENHFKKDLLIPKEILRKFIDKNLTAISINNKELNNLLAILKRRISLDENNLALCKILKKIAKCYQALSQYDKSKLYYNKCLLILKSLEGDNRKFSSKIYSELGKIEEILLNSEKAVYFFEKALRIINDYIVEDNEFKITFHDHISKIHYQLKNYTQVLKHQEAVLKIKIKLYGEEHIETSKSYNLIGLVYEALEKYERCLFNYEKSLKIRLLNPNNNSLLIAEAYRNLGNLHFKRTNYEKSKYYYENELRLTVAELGDNHLHSSDCYERLGKVHFSLRNYDKTYEFYIKNMELNIKLLGECNLKVAASYNNLGNLYEVYKDFGKALLFHKKCLRITINILGRNNLETAISYNNIGMIHKSTNKFKKAVRNFEKSLGISVMLHGEKHFLSQLFLKNACCCLAICNGDNKKLKEYQKKIINNHLDILVK